MKKIKLGFKDSLNTKKFKYGGYSVVMTMIVISIVVIFNLMLGKTDFKLDLTQNQMFSLSDQTQKAVKNLKQDVKIIGFYESGKEQQSVKEILNKYSSLSKNVTVQYLDPIQNPQYTKKYSKDGTTVTVGTIVVESNKKFKVIDPSKLVNYNNSTNKVESYAIESTITGAISYVTSDKNTTVFCLSGHSEEEISAAMKNSMENENYTVQQVNLATGDLNAKEGDVLLMLSPKKDLSEAEITKLKQYFQKGGKAVFVMDLLKEPLPNFNKVYESFGVGINQAIVIESDSEHNLRNPLYLVPEVNGHEIVNSIISAQLPVIFPGAQPIEQLKIKKQSIKIEPLLTTTKASWAKKDLNAQSLEKAAADLNGPFTVAAAITDGETNARMVLMSSAGFLSDNFLSTGSVGNMDFMMNSLNWVQDKKDSISIRPKAATLTYLSMNGFQQILFSGIVVVLIPLIILIAGVVVWVRRKNL